MNLTQEQTSNLYSIFNVLSGTFQSPELPPIRIDIEGDVATVYINIDTEIEAIQEELDSGGFVSEYYEPHIVVVLN